MSALINPWGSQWYTSNTQMISFSAGRNSVWRITDRIKVLIIVAVIINFKNTPKMASKEEESKNSTSSEEPEYDSDKGSAKSVASGSWAAPLKIVQYLSTNLIVGQNLTLADVEVSSCPTAKIKEMEDELIKNLKKV